MKAILPALVLALFLSGCLIIEELQTAPMQGGTHTYNISQETPPQVASPEDGAANQTLPEPTQESPEVRITVEETAGEGGATERNYFGIEFAEYNLLLEDLAPQGNGYCALVKIVKIQGTVMQEFDRAQICPGESYYWVSPEHHRYRIKVLETAPGYSSGAAWADIIIYS